MVGSTGATMTRALAKPWSAKLRIVPIAVPTLTMTLPTACKIVETPWLCVAKSAKPAAIIATPAPIPTAAIAIAPPKARIFATPAVFKLRQRHG